MKSSAESEARRASKASTMARSMPNSSMRRSFNGNGVNRKCGLAGWKYSRGCGSNTTAPAWVASLWASLRVAAISAWWPRCTPSKLPMASTAPRAEAGTLSVPLMLRMGQALPHSTGCGQGLCGRRLGVGSSKLPSSRLGNGRPCRHHQHRLTLQHRLAADRANAFEACAPLDGVELHHAHLGHHPVADLDGTAEIEGWRDIDGARPR